MYRRRTPVIGRTSATRFVAVTCLCIVTSISAHAETVAYVFSGVITHNASNTFTEPGFPDIMAGDAFTGRLVFDGAAVDTEPLATVGRFSIPGPPASLIQMTVNGLTFSSTTMSTIITNNNIFDRDSFSQVSIGDHLPPGWSVSGAQLIASSSFFVKDGSQTAHATDAIPSPFNLAHYQQSNDATQVRFTVQHSKTGTVTLTYPGGSRVYTNSVDLIGILTGLMVEGANLPGDFNVDGSVDAADYVVWRESIETSTAFEIWRSNFARTSIGGASTVHADGPAAVPEAASIVPLTLGLVGLLMIRQLKTANGSKKAPDGESASSESRHEISPR